MIHISAAKELMDNYMGNYMFSNELTDNYMGNYMFQQRKLMGDYVLKLLP